MKPQRRLELERRRAAEVPASTDGAERVPPGVESAILALQRSAGNVAVSRWLQRAPAGLLQRDRKLPDDADSRTDLGAVAKDLIVDKDTVSIPGLPFHFKSPRVPARPGLKVTTKFGGDMAAKPDPEKEKSLRDGLGSIGMIISGSTASVRSRRTTCLRPRFPEEYADRRPAIASTSRTST